MSRSRVSRSRTIILCTTALAALGSALPATAQDIPEDAGAPSGEIVVTARNKQESLQSVPMSITALTAETMAKKSVQGMDDIARFTPGLSFESYSGGFQSPVIRGQAQTKVTSLESNVATFYDGIYLPRSWTVDLGVAALERVEVVKGPQSARYGRNAFSGAINYISYKATTAGSYTAEATATAGLDDRYDWAVQAKLPVSSEFGLAASYSHSEYDGSWRNDNPYADVKVKPGTTGRIGGWNNDSYSISARAEPTPGMVVEASYTRFEIERETNPNYSLQQVGGQLNCGNIRGGNYSMLCGPVPSPEGSASADPRSYGAITKTEIARIHAAYEFLPGMTGSWLFGRITGKVDIANLTETNNNDCGTSCTYQNAPVGSIDYDSNEFRFDYDGKAIDFAFGGFLSKGVDFYGFDLVTAAPITNAANVLPLREDPASFVVPLERTLTTTLVRSVFGEAHWTSPDGTTRAGAEGRYSWNELGTVNRTTQVGYQRTFRSFTPRFTLEHDLGARSLLYVSAAKGTKAGGFNATAIAAEDKSYDEESNWTYEVGAKNRFFSNMLTFNLALFYTDWSAIQINSPDPNANDPNAVNITKNLGNAKVYGLEVDAVFQPDDHWAFDGNFSYAHGEYSADTVDARFSRTITPCDNLACPTDGNVGGNQIERTPRAKGAFGAQWGTQLPWDNGSMFVRGDLTWQDKMFTTPANESYIPARTLVNLRTGVTFGHFDLSLWARNAFDKKYVSNAYVVLLPAGNSYQLFWGQRRTVGLTLKAKY